MFSKIWSSTLAGIVLFCNMKPTSGQILSRGKTVTMSSRWSDWAGSRAVDGVYNTSADICNCCSSTNNQSDPWIKVDLGDTYIITRVLVYGRTDGNNEHNLTGLVIKTDRDQFAPPHYIWTLIDTFYNYAFNRPISTRYVRLSLPGTRRLVICELDVYNDRVISQGKDVTMSSNILSNTGGLAVDGNTSTNADECKCCARTRCNTTTWLQLDLGDYFNINYMVIYGKTDGWYPGQSYEGMEISFDHNVVHRIPESSSSLNTSVHFEFRVERSSSPVRFVKLTLSRNDQGCNSQLIVCEMQLYGDRIVSTRKEVTMSSQMNEQTGASRSVDGNLVTESNSSNSSCAVTERADHPWLNVDLGGHFLIHQLQIYGTFGLESFNNMSISFNGELVQEAEQSALDDMPGYYEYTPTIATDVQNVNFTIVDENRTLEVCEIVVFAECEKGWYGINCSSRCGHCKTGVCHASTGHCETCEDGFQNSDRFCNTPTACSHNYYGTNCTLKCGSCINDEPCNTMTGQCRECQDGFSEMDKYCKTECSEGTYGRNCTKTCGHCKNNKACNTVTGACRQCDDGFDETDLLCNTTCPDYTYGSNCSQTCGYCLDNKPCNKTTGLCPEGGYGYTDVTGSPVCPQGRYGPNCTSTCGFCRDGSPCNFTDGMCLECEDGYDERDLICRSECLNGTYGRNCSHTCGQCEDDEICRHTDGYCSSCKPGYHWNDSTCNTVCEDGYSGNCSTQCGRCRKPDVCDKKSGRCPNGCDIGFMGDNCTTVCPKGRYGVDCTELCGICLNEEACDMFTGDCTNGCSDGYQGNLCLESQSEPNTPIALYAGSIAAGLAICIVVIVAVLMRKRKRRLFARSIYGGIKGHYTVHKSMIERDNKGMDYSCLEFDQADSTSDRNI